MRKRPSIGAVCGSLFVSAILLSAPMVQAAQFSNDGRCDPFEQCYISCISGLVSAAGGVGIEYGASNTTCHGQCISTIDGRSTQVKDDCAFTTYKAFRDGKIN